ncbi:MAG: hypothetical protein GY754_47045 [bacterium]|nr:hypothetical protein [bacterium]
MNNLKKTALAVLCLTILTGSVFFPAPARAQYIVPTTSADMKPVPFIGLEDNLVITGFFTWSKFHDGNQYGLRFDLDYYLTDTWSLLGGLHFALNSPAANFAHHFGTLGLRVHLLRLGDFDIFGDGTAGFTLVIHDTLANKLVPTVEMAAGITYFTYFATFTAKAGYRKAGYYADGTYIDLDELVISGGVGLRFRF